jgi:two-component system, OmpR family, sensor histidine kinase KdpD
MRDPAHRAPDHAQDRAQAKGGIRRIVAGLRAAASSRQERKAANPVPTEARSAEWEMSSLHELTRRTLQLDLHREPGPWLVELIHEIFALEAVAIFDRDLHAVYQGGEWSIDPSELAQNVYHFETTSDDATTGISRRVLRLGAVPIGSLVLRGETSPLLNDAIADVAAMTFDRYRATANESRIEAEREAERMRTAVLDGLAHAYKTPLTAIRAAASGLQEMQRKLSPAQADLVELIDEQARLLSDLTTRLLKTARLAGSEGEAGRIAFTLQLSTVSVESLMEEACTLLGERAADTQLELPKEKLTLLCDRQMISLLLAQYVENACKYSDMGTPIVMRAERVGDEAVFSIRNFGPLIPQADRERIFDRFYRSASGVAHAAGTGIGLSVAKRVALAHGGSVWAASGAEEGTTFFAAIPLMPATATDPAPKAANRIANQTRSTVL